jgi:hypothetical protein
MMGIPGAPLAKTTIIAMIGKRHKATGTDLNGAAGICYFWVNVPLAVLRKITWEHEYAACDYTPGVYLSVLHAAAVDRLWQAGRAEENR